MKAEIEEHLNKALEMYSTGENYETMLEAKEEYFEVTGKANEDDDDYENRMNSFNDWYLLQFISKKSNQTIIKDYMFACGVGGRIAECFNNVSYSLFEFLGENFRGSFALKDILHNKKIILPKNHPNPSLLKNDLFVGRVLDYENKTYLMNGVCLLPNEIKSILKKECKRVRKFKDPSEELRFLLQVESLKTKWNRYGHVDATKIFVFQN